MSDREYVDFKKLKQRVSMRDVLAHYELLDELKEKDEDTLVGQCPVTGSASEAAFKVRLDKDIWYSFVLDEDGAGGNVLDFVARMEKTDVLGAANLIADWFPEDEATEEKSREEEADTHAAHDMDIFATFEAFFQEEIAILESGAWSEIKDTLSDYLEAETADVDAIAEQLSGWILRAYQRGYKLGKIQGQIDERISSLRK